MLWLWIIATLPAAQAAVPVELPAGQPIEEWLGLLTAADMEPGPMQGTPAIRLQAGEEQWTLVVRDTAGAEHRLSVPPPHNEAGREPIPTLALSYQGRGTLAGNRAAPRLGWDSGRVAIEVAPDTGTQLTVRTREALIQVVGTAFTVTRSGPRTDVEVHRGQVNVHCAAGGGADLLAGQSHRCGPASEAGWLALAHQLHSPGGTPDHALQAIDTGLAMADPQGLVTTELLALRAQVLADTGRLEEALEAVRVALERPHPHRRQQLLVLGVAVADAVGERRSAALWRGELAEGDQSGDVPGPVQ